MNKKDDPNIQLETNERHSRARRRLLQSIAAGGTAVSVKSMPEQWARPVLDFAMVPAHAEASVAATLTCEVGDTSSSGDFVGIINGNQQNDSEFDPPVVGDQTGTVTFWGDINDPDAEQGTQTFTLQPTANISPNSAGPIDLSVTGGGGVLSINAGANQVVAGDPGTDGGSGNNDANFSDVVVQITNPTGGVLFSQTVNFNFTGGGESCVIAIEFRETPLTIPGP